MYRKIVWCYVFVLTLLDISLNTKLSAQGKSHGVTVHDSLIEGITFQEWGKESGAAGGARGGRAVHAGALSLSPPALEFGRAALAAAHALTVTLTNTANTTMHLASVAGTTPDFHASFFESKTLPPQANTSFSVVYLGRREGPVSAHLYIHTSLGVHKYPVSAVGVASEWGVWPMVGVRVPLNATVEPLLTMHNPTDQTIQVSEVYSSGAWLGLALPGGEAVAPRGVWSVPPRTTRPLVRLRIEPPPQAPAATEHQADHPLTAYIRIKANITGGGLVVCVEARSVPAGEYVSPLQLRLRTRGSRDPPDTFDILAGNSAAAGVALEAGVWAARCGAAPAPPAPLAPHAPHAPHADHSAHNGDADKGTANGNGVKSEGVHVALLRPHLEPHQELTRAALFTLDYAALWAGYVGGGRGGGAWCSGWVRVGRAALPYSLRLLPGTLRLTPHQLHFVTANRDDSLRMREVRVRNEFPVPVHIARVDLGPDVEKYFEVESLAPLVVGGGAGAVAARVRLRALTEHTLSSVLTLRTNLTDYSLPLLLYTGRLDVEWEWPNSEDGELRLGVVGTSSTRRVTARVHNPAPTMLCVPEHTLELPGATLALTPCAHLRAPPPKHACRCIGAGGSLGAVLTVVAPARAGALRGSLALWAHTPRNHAPPAATRRAVSLSAAPGRVQALPLALPRAAPYAPAAAPLLLESSMALRMRVLRVTLPPGERALSWAAPPEPAELAAGRTTVGEVHYAPERLCEPDCYTGLDVTTPEGAEWLRRAEGAGAALVADAALQAARHAAFRAAVPRNVSLYVHTSHAVQLGARGAVAPWWPRLAPARAHAGLAPVAGAAPLRLRARNPSASHALLLQAVLAPPLALAGDAGAACAGCVWARDAWALAGWRAAKGAVRPWAAPANSSRAALPLLLLAPAAELELTLNFTPHQAAHLATYLYLRNNLTILEGVLLSGRGAYPSFELGGRRPGSNAPLLFEVSECGATVRRTVVARNTGQVGVLLRDWSVAGQPCQARGFRLTPCAPLQLQPNESRALTLAFSADYTLALVAAELSARTDTARAAFLLHAAAPARLLPRCAALAPRPPWEPAARAAATLLALAALALVLAAAALDAERELRRARAARPPPAPRQPLDLRALAMHAPPAAPPPRRPPARRRRTPRRDAPPLDPQAERRAFERWRAEVLGRNDDDDERSSEDADHDVPEPAPADREPLLQHEAAEPRDAPPSATDGYEADPETEDRPQGSGDDDAVSTGSGSASASSSSPTVEDRDDNDLGDSQARPTARSHAPGAEEGGARSESGAAPAPDAGRAARARRDAGDTPRRSERSRTAEPGSPRSARARPLAGKPLRKDKLCKRLRARPAASPPRASPPPPGGLARAPGALRWGASWSSVVAARAPAGAPLAPIGSDVRRRAEPPLGAGDHSLFYFNGEAGTQGAVQGGVAACRDADFSWRPPPPVERPTFSPARDFRDEPSPVGSVGAVGGVGAVGPVGAVGAVGSGSFRSLNSVWGSTLEPRPAAAAWLWGSYTEPAAPAGPVGPVRPPPGFGAPPRPVRPYDPFRSLASIWAPGALDWRSEASEGGAAEPDA